MTREEMVEAAWRGELSMAESAAIAEELGKSCATCANWRIVIVNANPNYCNRGRKYMPDDGSGYCRPGWEAK